MPRDETYSRPEPFIADMLALHDGKFLAHRNAVFDAADCRGQMAARALLRTVSHLYVPRERRAGPFHLQLTDLHLTAPTIHTLLRATSNLEISELMRRFVPFYSKTTSYTSGQCFTACPYIMPYTNASPRNL